MCCQTVWHLPRYVLALLFFHLHWFRTSCYLLTVWYRYYFLWPFLLHDTPSPILLNFTITFPIFVPSHFPSCCLSILLLFLFFCLLSQPAFLTAFFYPWTYRFALPFLELFPSIFHKSPATIYLSHFFLNVYFYLTELVEDRGFLDILHDLISDANPTVVSH